MIAFWDFWDARVLVSASEKREIIQLKDTRVSTRDSAGT